MNVHPSDKKHQRWRSVAAGLFLATLLVAPLVIAATRADPPRRLAVETITDSGSLSSRTTYHSLSDPGDVATFAYGYLEFDVDPRSGVPGFDSWPPGSPRR